MAEHPQIAPGGPGIPGHPELEELAALADGKLSRTDAAKVRAHLDSCEECYEVFAETLHLMEDLQGKEDEPEGDIVPFPFEGRRKSWARWAPAVAALLVVGVGVGLWRSHESKPDFSVADLAKPLSSSKQVPWAETTRGGGSEGERAKVEQQAFQAGVAVLNLQVGLVANEKSAASGAASQVCRVLVVKRDPKTGRLTSDPGFLESNLTEFYGDLPGRLSDARKEPRSFAEEAQKKAEALRSSGSFEDEQPYFDLGMWAEAGRLAAAQKIPFRQKAQASHLLRQLEKYRNNEKDADLPDKVITALKTIDRLPDDQHSDLKSAFETILLYYYRQGQPYEEAP